MALSHQGTSTLAFGWASAVPSREPEAWGALGARSPVPPGDMDAAPVGKFVSWMPEGGLAFPAQSRRKLLCGILENKPKLGIDHDLQPTCPREGRLRLCPPHAAAGPLGLEADASQVKGPGWWPLTGRP